MHLTYTPTQRYKCTNTIFPINTSTIYYSHVLSDTLHSCSTLHANASPRRHVQHFYADDHIPVPTSRSQPTSNAVLYVHILCIRIRVYLFYDICATVMPHHYHGRLHLHDAQHLRQR
ncbi:hypothetical protein Pcinc_004087 [Petrolisthes cinctipes]|uniref:Uncharacterized protein n=1 Tax=Petrolisthes cinctipes TaxID=88211 RepID=A0AAE1L443_PETCI|nr:hypothetical protein Pcinc_004087 [Petrolisthes cinctipes]